MIFLLDTNALIYLQNGRLAVPLPEGSYAFSVISEIELLSWPQMEADADSVWRGLLSRFRRVELDAAVCEVAIRLRRVHRLRLPDAIIAASALAYQATLLTDDQRLLAVPDVRSQALELKHE